MKETKRPCNHPGCSRMVIKPERYCIEHISKRAPDNRPNAYQRGYTREWQRYRKDYLAKHPLCAQCLKHGRLTEATVVDHIKPHRGDREIFWDRNNHQALCKRCHDRKTAKSDGGFGRKYTKNASK